MPAGDAPAASGGRSGGEAGSEACSDGGKAPILARVDVQITLGKPPERIEICQGQTVSEVVAEFTAQHGLAPSLSQRLEGMLADVLQKLQAEGLPPAG